MSLFSLTNKSALITGASRGIGKACAIALANAGAHVCLVLRKGSGQETLDELTALGMDVKAVYCDLGDLEAVKAVFQQALELMNGEIHILVNCAGIQRRAPALEFPETDWDDVS
jgi:2-dehydro-3-deoxy-D-gluconate 5-dehydrogenase